MQPPKLLALGAEIINIVDDWWRWMVGHITVRHLRAFAMFSIALTMVSLGHLLAALGEAQIAAALGLTAVALTLAIILEAREL